MELDRNGDLWSELRIAATGGLAIDATGGGLVVMRGTAAPSSKFGWVAQIAERATLRRCDGVRKQS